MIRCEIKTPTGTVAMLLPDGSAGSYAMAIRLASEVRVPATVYCVPIPPDITGRHALYWYPKRTPPKEIQHDTTTPDVYPPAAAFPD